MKLLPCPFYKSSSSFYHIQNAPFLFIYLISMQRFISFTTGGAIVAKYSLKLLIQGLLLNENIRIIGRNSSIQLILIYDIWKICFLLHNLPLVQWLIHQWLSKINENLRVDFRCLPPWTIAKTQNFMHILYQLLQIYENIKI